jgi:YD repeat-containing protein
LVGGHVVQKNYCIISELELLTALSAAGLTNIDPQGTMFARTQTTDEDGKQVLEFSNAFGQKVASLAGGQIATFMQYDSRGNLIEAVNPKGQHSYYRLTQTMLHQ